MKPYIAPEQGMLKYGFTDFKGNKWPDNYVDRYNQISTEINKTANKEIIHGSLIEQERQFWLDQRHKLFIELISCF